MNLYPFLLLGGIFVGVLVLPPLVAAYVDLKREAALRRWAESRLLSDEEPTERQRER